MKQSSREAIRTSLKTFFAKLQEGSIPQEGRWIHQRSENGGWQGAFVERPSVFRLLIAHEPLVEQLSNELSPTLTAEYPDHMTKLIGLPGTGGGILQPRMILWTLAEESLKRFGGWNLNDEEIESLLDETTHFFDSSTVRIRLFAPLLNLQGPADLPTIAFGGGTILRPITNEEATQFYGGNSILRPGAHSLIFPDFVFVHELEVQKIFFDTSIPAQVPFWRKTQEVLDRAILALSSFKQGGALGYDGIRITLAEVAFGIGGQHFWGGDHVPPSHYELTAEEAIKLEAHAQRFETIHPTLEMACQRLVDSTRRTKPRDSIVDAVVGLESIVLVEVAEKQRGETRFRFSLNYASLFETPARRNAFYLARDLYDLRSKIAHGGEPKTKEKIAGKEMTMHEIATLARSVLRETIAKFLQNAAKPDFLAESYWLTKVLDL